MSVSLAYAAPGKKVRPKNARQTSVDRPVARREMIKTGCGVALLAGFLGWAAWGRGWFDASPLERLEAEMKALDTPVPNRQLDILHVGQAHFRRDLISRKDPRFKQVLLSQWEILKLTQRSAREGVAVFAEGVQLDHTPEMYAILDSNIPYGNKFSVDDIHRLANELKGVADHQAVSDMAIARQYFPDGLSEGPLNDEQEVALVSVGAAELKWRLGKIPSLYAAAWDYTDDESKRMNTLVERRMLLPHERREYDEVLFYKRERYALRRIAEHAASHPDQRRYLLIYGVAHDYTKYKLPWASPRFQSAVKPHH